MGESGLQTDGLIPTMTKLTLVCSFSFFGLKQMAHPRIKITFFWPVVLFIHLDWFTLSWWNLETPALETNAFTNIIHLNVTRIVENRRKQKQQCVLTDIMTWLLKTVHSPYCKQFNVGMRYRHAQGSASTHGREARARDSAGCKH